MERAKNRPLVKMFIPSLCLIVGAATSNPAEADNPIASDPCVLITQADLHTVLGVSFPRPQVSNDVESRQCAYETDKWLVSIFTGNEELSEFQADGKAALKRNDSWNKTVKVNGLSAPFYAALGEGRLVVWKNKTRFTVEVHDVTFTMSDEALEAAREKLVNIGLGRIK